MATILPDVLLDYQINVENQLPIGVVYVRPRTNLVKYEKEILLGVQPFADVIYLANLNGRIFIKNALVIEHYSTQYKFTIFAKDEISGYPEMITSIENHFQKKFDKMNIIGAFDGMLQLGLTAEELFNTIVDDQDFFKFYGQTIKKIKNHYIVNYNIPAILEKYTPQANIFVIAIRLKDEKTTFKEIDQSIFEKISNDANTPIIDAEKFDNLSWDEKIRRTYHISQNHLKATFDFLDYVFHKNGDNIDIDEVPLSHQLVSKNILTKDQLLRIKDYNLVYIEDQGKKKLINILEEAKGMSQKEILELFKKIIWQ
ncbi:MAG: hypothetical protein MJB14_05255 [Spirochaetes bacterium]|nr:hypothetical protein [Spirochaetota bacterium]